MLICRAGQSGDHSVRVEAAGIVFTAAWNGTYLSSDRVFKKLAEFWSQREKMWWDGVGVKLSLYLVIISLKEDCEAGTPHILTCSALSSCLLCQTLFCEPIESSILILFIIYLTDQLDTVPRAYFKCLTNVEQKCW